MNNRFLGTSLRHLIILMARPNLGNLHFVLLLLTLDGPCNVTVYRDTYCTTGPIVRFPKC